MQNDPSFDDLINNDVWTGAGDQYLYGQPQQQHQTQPQDLYANFGNNQQHQQQQSSFPNPNIPSQQQPYTSSPYTSQYVSQYQQNPRPSTFFGATSTNVDPSLQSASPSPYRSNQDPTFTSQPGVSPHYLQYGMTPAHQPLNRGLQQQPYQQQQQPQVQPKPNPNTFDQRSQDLSSLYFNNLDNGNLQHNAGNQVHYPALPAERQNNDFRPTVNPLNVSNNQIYNLQRQANSASPLNVPLQQQARQVQPQQNPLRLIQPEVLRAAEGDASRRPLAHAPFLTFENTPVQITLTLKSGCPISISHYDLP